MISMRPVDATMFPAVYESLLRDFRGGQIPEDLWRRLFEYAWKPDPGLRGHGLFDGERIIGFMGFIFSEREIAGCSERICNVTTLIVAEAYREHSLSFVLAALKMPDVTITDLTPTPTVAAILRRIGFRELEQTVTVLLPQLGAPKRDAIEIVHDPAAIASELGDEQRGWIEDHRPYPCEHLVARTGDGLCHVVYGRHVTRSVGYATLYAISRPDLFQREGARIRAEILARTGSVFAVVDTRLLAGADPPFSFRWALGAPRMFRSKTLAPHQVDNLYSEFVLLNLGGLPRLRRAAIVAFAALLAGSRPVA